jgi:hypothetical protein
MTIKRERERERIVIDFYYYVYANRVQYQLQSVFGVIIFTSLTNFLASHSHTHTHQSIISPFLAQDSNPRLECCSLGYCSARRRSYTAISHSQSLCTIDTHTHEPLITIYSSHNFFKWATALLFDRSVFALLNLFSIARAESWRSVFYDMQI